MTTTETKTQHTAGPWKASTHGSGEFQKRVVLDKHCGLVLTLNGGYGPGKEHADQQELANAHLVAAAPEMLAALEATNKVLNQHFMIDDSEEGGNSVHDQVREAINKAKGQ